MRIYALSDIHGHLREFEEALQLTDLSGENRLILLGDYVHGPDSRGVVRRIIELQDEYGEGKIIALAGNHEAMVVDGSWPLEGPCEEEDARMIAWMKRLPLYYRTESQIFVHAGIDEDAGKWWEWGVPDEYFIWKFPAQTGRFYMDIIAGHVATCDLACDPEYHDIYFDGESHYYIDGQTHRSRAIPVLMYDTTKKRYYQMVSDGARPICSPYSRGHEA